MPNVVGSTLQSVTGVRIARWAHERGFGDQQLLAIDMGPRPTAIPLSVATGEALVSNGAMGADIIRLAATEGFVPHTHPGDHLLIVLGGEGTITVGGTVHPTRAGEIYMVSGEVPHAVGAITDHVILSVGSPHRAIDASDRMELVAYDAVLSELSELRCLICAVSTAAPERLHDAGCPHCPCVDCHPGRH
jgi:quercetin dioxygenase-like cupin family protein